MIISRKPGPEEERLIIEMYKKYGKVVVIAKTLHHDPKIIRRILVKHGIKLPSQRSKELREKIVSLYKQGLSGKQISKMLGINYQTVLYHLHKAGFKSERIFVKNKLMAKKRKQLMKELLESKGPMLVTDLIRILNISYSSIISYIRDIDAEKIVFTNKTPRGRPKYYKYYKDKLRRLWRYHIVSLKHDPRLYEFIAKIIVENNLVPEDRYERSILTRMLRHTGLTEEEVSRIYMHIETMK